MEEEDKPFEFISISSLSSSELLTQAESAFSSLQYPLALELYSQAYSLAPKEEELLCSFANFLIETGDIRKADKLLKEALQIESSSNYKKYMQMAELSCGKLCLELNMRGVSIMEERVRKEMECKSELQINELRRDLGLGYSAIAELYQTDLISEKESELKCREYVEKALQADSKCLDAYIQLVNFHLNKDERESAANCLNQVFKELEELRKEELAKQNELLEKCNTNIKEKEEEEKKENSEEDNEAVYDIDFKLTVAKLFIEIEDWGKAQILLEQYYEEESKEAEVIYLLALCFFKEKKYKDSREYIEEFEILGSEQKIEDEELLSAMNELKEELGKLGEEEEVVEVVEEGGEEGEWMDLE